MLYAVRGATEAQVRARQLDLARLKENRGKSWAELALDRETARLLSLGTKRDAIRDQLGVGEHRIARVRRRHRTGTGSAPSGTGRCSKWHRTTPGRHRVDTGPRFPGTGRCRSSNARA